ncbi:MAG: hypothetical protein RL641_359 [Candidatus Parcubacteria bacterium]
MKTTLSFNNSISLFKFYLEKRNTTFTAALKNLAQEAIYKTVDLEELRIKIIELHTDLENNAYNPISELKKAAASDPVLVEYFEKNPNPQKINSTVAYSISAEQKPSPFISDNKKLSELRRSTIDYYQLAHRVIKILEILPELDKIKCKPITAVRNHLIQHPEGRASLVTLDSFGYSTEEGPIVKALREGSEIGAHPDKGFSSNNNSMVNSLEKVLSKKNI